MGAKDSKSSAVAATECNLDLKARLKEAKATKQLSCTSLQLASIPKELGRWAHFERLELLDLSRNKLAELPPEFDLLAKNLRRLELQFNHFAVFPPVVLKLTKLEVLNLNNNKLTIECFPEEEFGAMTSLQKLHLCSNQLHALPYVQLATLSFQHALHFLSIQQNYLDLSEMHDFLEQMERSQCRVSYCHQHVPQVVWRDPTGTPAAIYLGGVHSAENVKWLEVNRITNVLSMGEYPFRTEKIGVKRPKRPRADSTNTAITTTITNTPASNDDDDDDDDDDDGGDSIAAAADEDDDGSGSVDDDAKLQSRKEVPVTSLARRIYPLHFKHVYIEIEDMPSSDLIPHLETTNEFIREVMNSNQRILIHCAAGISRSASVVIAFLIAEKSLSYSKAFASVRRARRCVQPNEGFIYQLRKYYKHHKKARELLLAQGQQQQEGQHEEVPAVEESQPTTGAGRSPQQVCDLTKETGGGSTHEGEP